MIYFPTKVYILHFSASDVIIQNMDKIYHMNPEELIIQTPWT